jgi:hypothetical protein
MGYTSPIMKKSLQNAVFWIFCLAFLVLGPVVLLYTAGYRIALNNQRIRQNGALDVETFPRGATVQWNGEAVSSRTPTVLSALLPGEGLLTVNKAGYQPFSHPLTITSGRTNYVDIALFPTRSPEPLAQPEPVVATAPAYTPLFTQEGTTVAVRLADGEEPIAWLPTDQYTVLYAQSHVLLVAGARHGSYALSLAPPAAVRPLPLTPTVFAPQPTRSPNLFLLSDGHEVRLFAVDSGESWVITRQSSPISALGWMDNEFGYFVADAQGITAYSRDTFGDGRAITPLITNTSVTALVVQGREALDYQTADGSWFRLPLL